jgi:hypothetical protein
MKNCCLESGHRYFESNYPLSASVKEDVLAAYLINLCKKWGKITNLFADNIYIRSTSSLALGVDAKTGTIHCDVCGGTLDYIFIGARLAYFIWRINMTCASYWDTANKAGEQRLTLEGGSANWPREEQLEQLRIALEMYFGESAFLGVEGLAELNQQILKLPDAPAAIHSYIVDFAELFILFHEIQHQVPVSRLGPTPIGIHVQLPSDLEITPKRADWWTTELTADSNSLFLLLLSATSVFNEQFKMTLEDAKTQAASLVCTGADSALHTLQFLEEQRYGKVNLDAAATNNIFVRHPPSAFRRNMLSLSSFSLVTGKNADALYRREFTESWLVVAQNVASHMQVTDLLWGKYQQRRKIA